MERLEATFFARPKLPSGRWFLTKPPCRRRFGPAVRKIVSAKGEMDGRDDYGGRLVDENILVLRMRIREMKMSEVKLPSGWMEWEKKYYEHYNEDVCEAVGLLQLLLMNTRPCLALGMVALIILSVPISIYVLMFYAVELSKGVLAGFHLG